MDAPDLFLYEYSVVRYVPRVDREEFVNIGLVMMCKRQKWLRGEILINEEKVKAFCKNANINALAGQTSLFMRNDVPSAEIPVEERYRWLVAVKSAVIQVSPSHPGLLVTNPNDGNGENDSAGLDAEFNRLFTELVK